MRIPTAKRLAGKTILITGGAQGIGAQVARELIGHGARVAILDRDVAAAQLLVGELDGTAAAFDVNLVGVFHTVHAALPHVRQRRGYILAVASIGAVITGPTVSGYMAAKAGVESLVRSLRIELGDGGVKVGITYFGVVDTGLAQEMIAGSGVGAMMATLPAVVGKPIPVEAAAAAITSGIARRARRVYAPRGAPILVDLRVPLVLGDRLLAVWPSMRRTVRDADSTEVSA